MTDPHSYTTWAQSGWSQQQQLQSLKKLSLNPDEFVVCSGCAPTDAWVEANNNTYADGSATYITGGGILSAVRRFFGSGTSSTGAKR